MQRAPAPHDGGRGASVLLKGRAAVRAPLGFVAVVGRTVAAGSRQPPGAGDALVPLEIAERDVLYPGHEDAHFFTKGCVGFTRNRVGSDVPDAWVIRFLIHAATW